MALGFAPVLPDHCYDGYEGQFSLRQDAVHKHMDHDNSFGNPLQVAAEESEQNFYHYGPRHYADQQDGREHT